MMYNRLSKIRRVAGIHYVILRLKMLSLLQKHTTKFEAAFRLLLSIVDYYLENRKKKCKKIEKQNNRIIIDLN